jgi:hypothetical protein
LVLASSESALRTVASRALWAAVIAAVEPVPECDEPVGPVVVPVPVPPVLVVPVAVPVPAAPVVVPVVVVLLPVPDAAETWPDSAWAKVRLALATWPWAVASAYFSEVVSKVARISPAVTFWPMVTGTVATVPVTAKDTVAALEGSVVPVACSVCMTECEPAAAVT